MDVLIIMNSMVKPIQSHRNHPQNVEDLSIFSPLKVDVRFKKKNNNKHYCKTNSYVIHRSAKI